MRKLIVFNHVSVDGYFVDAKGDMSWAHTTDPQYAAFARENARGGGLLLFGRLTYELMASYWPTPLAATNNPVVAERMNSLPKVVFSRTLESPGWSNTQVVKGDPVSEVRRLKREGSHDMAILGSGSIVSQLAPAALIDEYQIVVVPVVLGAGRTLFERAGKLTLRLTSSRTFANGYVLLCYSPSA